MGLLLLICNRLLLRILICNRLGLGFAIQSRIAIQNPNILQSQSIASYPWYNGNERIVLDTFILPTKESREKIDAPYDSVCIESTDASVCTEDEYYESTMRRINAQKSCSSDDNIDFSDANEVQNSSRPGRKHGVIETDEESNDSVWSMLEK